MCSNRQDGHQQSKRGWRVERVSRKSRQIRLCWLLVCLTHVPVWLQTSTKFTLWASPHDSAWQHPGSVCKEYSFVQHAERQTNQGPREADMEVSGRGVAWQKCDSCQLRAGRFLFYRSGRGAPLLAALFGYSFADKGAWQTTESQLYNL